jgi:hypothetical protein
MQTLSLKAQVLERVQKRYLQEYRSILERMKKDKHNEEFDPGSGRTLAACLTHASQGESPACGMSILANG